MKKYFSLYSTCHVALLVALALTTPGYAYWIFWFGDIIITRKSNEFVPLFDLISFVRSFVARGRRVLLAPAETKKGVSSVPIGV